MIIIISSTDTKTLAKDDVIHEVIDQAVHQVLRQGAHHIKEGIS